MKIRKIDNEIVSLGYEINYYIQDKQNSSENISEYPLVLGKIAFPKINSKSTEILWPKHLKIKNGRQIISVRIRAPGFPSADSSSYFRILLSPSQQVEKDTIELIYDSAKGLLLRQIVNN